jgi:hypothetical protein
MASCVPNAGQRKQIKRGLPLRGRGRGHYKVAVRFNGHRRCSLPPFTKASNLSIVLTFA